MIVGDRAFAEVRSTSVRRGRVRAEYRPLELHRDACVTRSPMQARILHQNRSM